MKLGKIITFIGNSLDKPEGEWVVSVITSLISHQECWSMWTEWENRSLKGTHSH